MPKTIRGIGIFEKTALMHTKPIFGYPFAVFACLLATSLRFMSDDILPQGFPFLTYFPAVVLTALFAGRGPAILCAVLSALGAWYYFMVPEGEPKFHTTALVALVYFVAIVAIDIFIIDVVNRTIRRLYEHAQYNQKLLEQQKTLFAELHHRVSNNLSFVSGLLSIHQMRSQGDVVAVAALEDARLRLETMSQVHRRIYDPVNADIPLQVYLEELCQDVVTATGAGGVVCEVQAAPLKLDLETLLNLSLVIVECMTNSIKHAYKDGEGGVIRVILQQTGENSCALTIRDSGPGFPEGFDPAQSNRLGFKILYGFARSLHGDLTFANDNGGVIHLTFPESWKPEAVRP